MDKELKSKLTSKETWLRLVLMIVYAVVAYFVQFIIWVLAFVQFLMTLFLGCPNKDIQGFTVGLSGFMGHIFKYLTYNIDDRPFPFTPWKKE